MINSYWIFYNNSDYYQGLNPAVRGLSAGSFRITTNLHYCNIQFALLQIE